VLVTSDRVGNVRAGSGLFLPHASFLFVVLSYFLVSMHALRQLGGACALYRQRGKSAVTAANRVV
jgi:hypothetical protein